MISQFQHDARPSQIMERLARQEPTRMNLLSNVFQNHAQTVETSIRTGVLQNQDLNLKADHSTYKSQMVDKKSSEQKGSFPAYYHDEKIMNIGKPPTNNVQVSQAAPLKRTEKPKIIFLDGGNQPRSKTPDPYRMQKDTNRIICCRYNNTIESSLVADLDSDALLNSRVIDLMIDFYNEITTKIKPSKHAKVVKTTYWRVIIESAYSLDISRYTDYSIKKYTSELGPSKRHESIFASYEKIAFPINLHNAHWILAVINNVDQTIEVYDSLYSEKSDNLEQRAIIDSILKRYIHDMALASKICASSLEAQTLADCYQTSIVFCPLQSGPDCGVHMLKNIELLFLGKKITKESYGKTDVMRLRKAMYDLIFELGLHENRPLIDFKNGEVQKFVEYFMNELESNKKETLNRTNLALLV